MLRIALKAVTLVRDLISLVIIGLMVAVLSYSLVRAVGWLDHLPLQSTQEGLSAIFGFLASILMLLNGKRCLRYMDKMSERIAARMH